jgi:site-specific DNA-cytosine methylase
MRVLLACEESQAVTKEFRKLGHEAYSCDILPCSGGHPEWHLQQDVTELLRQNWDMIIAFPPCTHLTVSGAKHFEKKRADGSQLEAIEFFMQFINADCDKIAVENPIGIMSGNYITKHFPDTANKYNLPLKASQIIQPYEYGHEAQKSTCLWLKGLPELRPTNIVGKGDFYTSPTGKKMAKWICDPVDKNGKKLSYSSQEIKILRSKTFPGIAKAMAEQWG